MFNSKNNSIPNLPTSNMYANSIFHFLNNIEWIIQALTERRLVPRYCKEDVSFLELNGVNEIAIPEKCFCNIALHKISNHITEYGGYGIAFSKEWAVQNQIHPVHYVYKYSNYCKHFSEIFNMFLQNDLDNDLMDNAANFLLNDLLLLKPYFGKNWNWDTMSYDADEKCLADECEWRFVPDLPEDTLMKQIILTADEMSKEKMDIASEAIKNIDDKNCWLNFDYKDVLYIIVNTTSDVDKIMDCVKRISLDRDEELLLMSKILVWDQIKGDL